MGLRVNTNLISMTAQRNLGIVTTRLEGNFRRLSSGLRIASAADDAAGLGISERMRGQIRSLAQAARNAQDGVSLVQTAEGALNEVNANLVRMRELSLQAANGTLDVADRAVIDTEFQALLSEISRIASSTDFNGLPLLDGTTGTLDMQVGADAGEVIPVETVDTTVNTLFAGSTLDVLTVTGANTALPLIDSAINSVTNARGNLGATQNRLQTTIRSIQNAGENLSAAESRIRDVDVAEETADLTRNTIMQQAAVSVLAQANTQPQIALTLLQG